MLSLITWFLNLVMHLEAHQQAGANPYGTNFDEKLPPKRVSIQVPHDSIWRCYAHETSIPGET